MKKLLTLTLACVMVLSLVACESIAAPATDFPKGPVKILVTHGPGGVTDIAARGIAPFLSKYLGVAVPVENMEGGGGRNSRVFLFKEKPDGYTLLSTGMPSTQVGELLEEGNYKTMEFTYLYNVIGQNPRVILVPADSPYKSFNDLLAKSQEQELLGAGSGGRGSSGDMQSKLLAARVGLKHRFVPYNSDAEALVATLGNQVDFLIVNLGGVMSAINNGQARILTIHADDRIDVISDVPTLKELGFEGVSIPTTVGIVGPPNMPADVQKALNDAFAKALADPEFLTWAKNASLIVEPLNPQAFKQMSQGMYDQVKDMLPLLQGVQN